MPTSSSSAAASSAPAPPGTSGRTASRAASWSSSAIRPTARVVVSRHGRHSPAVLHAGHRADGAVQRQAVEDVRSAAWRRPTTRPRAWFRQRGYLFLANAATSTALMQRYEQERRAGARRATAVASTRSAQIAARRLMLDDILFGVLGPDDGYANPREVLFGFVAAPRRRAPSIVSDEVIGIDARRRRGHRRAARERRHDLERRWSSMPPGRGRGRVAAMAGLRRAGRADAADAVSLRAAANAGRIAFRC